MTCILDNMDIVTKTEYNLMTSITMTIILSLNCDNYFLRTNTLINKRF